MSLTLPYLLAYKPPLCGPCETNALSQGGSYSEGGSYMLVDTVLPTAVY
jgi:hypothetical protein